jgi:hypothetical protein
MNGKYVVVGNIHFAIEHIEGKSLTDIKEMFPHVRVELLKTVHEKVNPKRNKKK